MNLLWLLLLVGFLILIYYNCSKYEGFETQHNHKTIIKKTQKKKCVWKHPKGDYSIWEAEPLEGYFPVSQIFQKGISEPKQALTIVKSNTHNEKDKPVSYIPILELTSNHALWLPRCNEGYSALGHIVSDKEPSIHQYRCVPTKNTQSTKLEEIMVKHKDFQLWKLKNSPYFAGLNLYNLPDNEQLPKLHLRALLSERCVVETSLRHTMTTEYTEISTHYNPYTEQTMSIWRPVIPKEQPYISLGDIVRNHEENPNGKLETILVHKEDIKSPIHYGSYPVITLEDKETKDTISFWKPVPPDGYVSLGYVVKKGKEEPQSTSLIGCVPLEMTNTIKQCNPYIKQIWNNQPKTNNDLIGIWINEYNLFHIKKGKNSLDCNALMPVSILNNKLFYRKEDNRDKDIFIKVKFQISKDNKVDFNEQRKIEAIRNTLSSMSTTEPFRFEFVNNENNILTFRILKRKEKSRTKKAAEVLIHIKKHMETQQLDLKHVENKKFVEVTDEESKEVIGHIISVTV